MNEAVEIMGAYLDDMMVGSDSPAEHLQDLRNVFERKRKEGLWMNLAKRQFGIRLVELLGHRVSFGEVLPSDDYTNFFEKYKEPTCAAESLRFIGLVGLFREHVDNCSDRLAPLYVVLEGSGWHKKKPRRRKIQVPNWDDRWGEEQRRAIVTLREILASP